MSKSAIVTNCLLAAIAILLGLIFYKMPRGSSLPITEGEYLRAGQTSPAAIQEAESRILRVRVTNTTPIPVEGKPGL